LYRDHPAAVMYMHVCCAWAVAVVALRVLMYMYMYMQCTIWGGLVGISIVALARCFVYLTRYVFSFWGVVVCSRLCEIDRALS
jgi:hypothetical protein